MRLLTDSQETMKTAMDKPIEDAAHLAKAFGYLTQAEVGVLKLLSASCGGNALIVNVGAGAGTSTLAMAEGNPSARIISIDVSPGGPMGGLEGERNAFKNAGLDYFPEQILIQSHEAADSWSEDKIDLLFIDDGHLEPEIRGDIEKWMFHVKHGGILAFHDYGAKRWPAVKKVVDELLLNKFDRIAYVDTVIAFRKKGEL